MNRRRFLAGATAVAVFNEKLRPIIVSLNILLDHGAHSGKGLDAADIARFNRFQEKARREYATSGISFELRVVEGAYLRTQGYSDIPEKFLARRAINVFVTETLGYDIDRDRTGGCSIGPRARGPHSPPDPYFKTYLGLRDARETTLEHEYTHHFTLDTQRNPTAGGNFWADLRNDYWLWRQRNGVPIPAFRACAHSEWARFGDAVSADAVIRDERIHDRRDVIITCTEKAPVQQIGQILESAFQHRRG